MRPLLARRRPAADRARHAALGRRGAAARRAAAAHRARDRLRPGRRSARGSPGTRRTRGSSRTRRRARSPGTGSTPRGGTVLHGDAGVIPWGPTYDVVCAFEVLEHIADDAGGPGRWVKHVRKGGHVVLSVPEDPDRFGPSDVQVGHYRRYTEESLRELLTGAGLEVPGGQHYGWPLGYLLEAAVPSRAAGAPRTARPDRGWRRRSHRAGLRPGGAPARRGPVRRRTGSPDRQGHRPGRRRPPPALTLLP